MIRRQTAILALLLLLFSFPSYANETTDSEAVEQFGLGFDEVVIANSSDFLSNPRDLEFHPGRANELWIANRATDSITIVENTGLENQTSQNRADSYGNHFLEEVSAISFGAYHPEFDWQWGSAQETGNTYCGQAPADNFMGPTLWPSSLDHFAVENQNNGNGLLGSHIDMNHESPFGVGIAHDYDNVYWYNDGYYGELVRYDFKEDHDTGEDDHSDAVVRRYSEIKLTHSYGTPAHMVMDKSNGILYIADAGANRVLWVNTDDTTYVTTDIMDDTSRLEPLAEYSQITGVEWGVLATGLNRPSGIALDEGQLFVSENGNGKIVAYDLDSDGKGGVQLDMIQTTASSIMGLEIGPNGHLYYVDNGQDEVVRIDPYSDEDDDGIADQFDNCPFIANPLQANYDNDAFGDVCDSDDDNDTVPDDNDMCSQGFINWVSSSLNDHDGDGCMDSIEDSDDDNDGFADEIDACPFDPGTSSLGLELGCSDYDDDGYSDSVDAFPGEQSQWFDSDGDGYGDNQDGFEGDGCSEVYGTSTEDRFGCSDLDSDGWSDQIDAFPNEDSQHLDSDGDGYGDAINGYQADECPSVSGTSTLDRFGCLDTDTDGWSNLNDVFDEDPTQFSDSDGDGYGDNPLGTTPDSCPGIFGMSMQERYGCPDSDGDGWEDMLDAFTNDARLWSDTDNDGYADQQGTNRSDDCPQEFGRSVEDFLGCVDSDGDGWSDSTDAYPNDASKQIASDQTEDNSYFFLGLVLTILAVSIFGIGLLRKNTKSELEIQPLPMAMNRMAPPLPPGGLPAGWTMEQWAYYGEDYLKRDE